MRVLHASARAVGLSGNTLIYTATSMCGVCVRMCSVYGYDSKVYDGLKARKGNVRACGVRELYCFSFAMLTLHLLAQFYDFLSGFFKHVYSIT